MARYKISVSGTVVETDSAELAHRVIDAMDLRAKHAPKPKRTKGTRTNRGTVYETPRACSVDGCERTFQDSFGYRVHMTRMHPYAQAE